MVRQLLLLTAAVAASLDQADVSTCGALFSIDGKCQNDSAALLQVAFAPETYPFGKAVRASNDDSDGPVGPAGSKQDLIATKNAVITSMSDWHSSRDLACVDRVQHVTISPRFTMQIFSAVPVFGKNETYIALLADHSGDAWWPEVPLWAQAFDAFVMFCAGPDGSHKTQVIARGFSWVCPWPREEWASKQFKVLLEAKDGTNLGTVSAEHDPKLLGQYKTMACVRDIFSVSPEEHRVRHRMRPFSGAFKQWVEWMEWSSMHGLEHFLIYTFEGTDLAAIDIIKPYLDSGIASRVHFKFYFPLERHRQGQLINDCLYRAKNHAKWLVPSVDVDEYLVFPGKVLYFNWDNILKEQGISEDEVASLQIRRVRFARARPDTFEISSCHREPTLEVNKKTIIKVDSVDRAWAHGPSHHCWKSGTKQFLVDRRLAVIHHYRWPDLHLDEDYEHFNFKDPNATMTDETLQNKIPMLKAAIAKRFNLELTKVTDFLTKLGQRRPPESDSGARSDEDLSEAPVGIPMRRVVLNKDLE